MVAPPRGLQCFLDFSGSKRSAFIDGFGHENAAAPADFDGSGRGLDFDDPVAQPNLQPGSRFQPTCTTQGLGDHDASGTINGGDCVTFHAIKYTIYSFGRASGLDDIRTAQSMMGRLALDAVMQYHQRITWALKVADHAHHAGH